MQAYKQPRSRGNLSAFHRRNAIMIGEPNIRTNPREWLSWSYSQENAYSRKISRLTQDIREARKREDHQKVRRLMAEVRRVMNARKTIRSKRAALSRRRR
jgi:hypothetical protein